MKLVELKCKNCGAVLKVESGSTDIHCDHCKANYKLDDEVQHIKYDEMEKAGYDYEKGRIKAREEHKEEKARRKLEEQAAAVRTEKNAKNRKWKIILWIFFFPIMMTVWIWTKSSMSKGAKIALTAAIWIFFIIGANSNSNTQSSELTDNTDNFSLRFEKICDKVKMEYGEEGTVICQDSTAWSSNHDLNPESFPYEYRDINIDVSDTIAYEIRAIKDSSNFDYFKTSYTCDAIYIGDGGCIIGTVGDDLLYSIISYDGSKSAGLEESSNKLQDILSQL